MRSALLAVAILVALAPAASAQGGGESAWSCFPIPVTDGQLWEPGSPGGDWGAPQYCRDLLSSCAANQNDGTAAGLAREAFCSGLWCRSAQGTLPAGEPLRGRTPTFTSCVSGGDFRPQDCRTTSADSRPLEMGGYCGWLEEGCSGPTNERSDEHEDYCRSLIDPLPDPTAAGAPASPSAGSRDISGMNGGGSVTCVDPGSGLDADTRARCEQSGSIFRPHSLAGYGLDNFVDVCSTCLGRMPGKALQGLAQLVWYGFILAVNGVLELLERAFSLDLVDRTFNDLRDKLVFVHEQVIGTPWMLTAISIAGLWGIWNGLVRLRTIQTLGALLATVLMMVGALVVIYNPRDTVWYFSGLSSAGAKSVLGAATTGTTTDPDQALADSTGTVFDLLVREPWCGLQFGEVEFCERDMPGDGDHAGQPVAETWLSHSSNSDARQELYEELQDADGGPDGLVRLMNERGAADRLGLLALIAATLVGALIMLLWLGLRLLLAAIMVLILTLATPAVLLAPAFGDAGRSWFVKWVKRLAGALAAKLIFALFLAVVLLVSSMIASLGDLGWYPKWLLLLVFWWGVFLKRGELVGFLDGDGRGGSGFPRLATIYYGSRMARDVARAVTAPVRGGIGMVRRDRVARREGSEATISGHSEGRLRDRVRGQLLGDRQRERDQALDVVGQEGRRRTALQSNDRELRDAEGELRDAERELDREQQRLTQLQEQYEAAPAGPRATQLQRQMDQLQDDRLDAPAGLKARAAAARSRVEQLRFSREQLERVAWDPGELRAAESTVARYDGGPIDLSEREIDERIRTREYELAAQSPARDSDADRRDRELIRRINDPGGLSRAERNRARYEMSGLSGPPRRFVARAPDLEAEEQRAARREIAEERQRRKVFR